MWAWSSVCGNGPAVMGIVNVTPDSFSDGGRHLDPADAVEHGLRLAREGAALLDVGGESTRPGAEPVDEPEELRRVVPVVSGLAAAAQVPVSIDTTKAAVAAAAIDAGAVVVNDVSAGRADPAMLDVVARAGVGYVAMHMLGEPRTMQRAPRYADVTAEVGDFLLERLGMARDTGIAPEALCADPGIGFGKTVEHNLELLARLSELVGRLEVPVLVGTSRKSFLGTLTGAPVDGRDDATLATAVWSAAQGAAVLRVHRVQPVVEALRLLDALDEAAA